MSIPKNTLLCTLLVTLPALAQFGRGDGVWNTSGGDAQRSSWVRTDPKISPASVGAPGFASIWKVKLTNEPRQLNSLTAVALLDRYIGYRGFRSLGFLSGSGDRIFALDTDLGRVEWQKRLTSGAQPQGGSMECPGGMTAAVTRPVTTAFPAMPGGRGGGGRGNAAKGGVGEPDEGAVIIAEQAARAAAAANMAGAAGRGAAGRGAPGGPGRGAAGGPPRRMPNYIHAVSSDGMFHSLWVSNGDEPDPAVAFLPAGANVHGLIVVNGVAYASTGQGCGSAANGVWALDLESKQVTSWKADGDIAGSEGTAFGPDGTIYVATIQGSLVALEPKTLAMKGTYSGGAPGFTSSPVIFPYKGKTLVAAVNKAGVIHLMDAADQGSVFKSPAGADASGSGALATWQDPSGTPWILEPTAGSVIAWKIADHNGGLALERGWTSRGMVSPLTPMIVNGVIFAVSSGHKSAPAVLYALDGITGKELWNSGTTMTSFVHSGGLSGGSSQLYLGTYDGTLYAFGFPIEH